MSKTKEKDSCKNCLHYRARCGNPEAKGIYYDPEPYTIICCVKGIFPDTHFIGEEKHKELKDFRSKSICEHHPEKNLKEGTFAWAKKMAEKGHDVFHGTGGLICGCRLSWKYYDGKRAAVETIQDGEWAWFDCFHDEGRTDFCIINTK